MNNTEEKFNINRRYCGIKKLILLMLIISSSFLGMGQKVILLDNYYNNEFSENGVVFHHYRWDNEKTSGFSGFGELFKDKGCKLLLLHSKPDLYKLNDASVYIIVDPDTKEETPNPKFMDRYAANAIVCWVKQGGVLLVMANDSGNCDLDSLNLLMSMFDMKFNDEILHLEQSEPGKPRNFNSCASINLPDNILFRNVKKIFIKSVSSISCGLRATPLLQENGKTLMAEGSFGKGKVIAIGDPWLYNEYFDHWFLPQDFDNYKAAKNLVDLLINNKKGK